MALEYGHVWSSASIQGLGDFALQTRRAVGPATVQLLPTGMDPSIHSDVFARYERGVQGLIDRYRCSPRICGRSTDTLCRRVKCVPETLGEQLLKKTGFTTKLVPPYDKLEERINGEEYSHLTGRDKAICDFTGEAVNAVDFDFISPWEIRSDNAFRGFLGYIAERMDSETMAAFTIMKDWSYWLTSKKRMQKELRSRLGLTS